MGSKVRTKMWKLLGLAGVAGVTATGIAITRHERERRFYTPEEIRHRLHQRYAEIETEGS